MSDYVFEKKSYRVIKLPTDSEWKTITVSKEEWNKLMAVVEAAKACIDEAKSMDFNPQTPMNLVMALKALESE